MTKPQFEMSLETRLLVDMLSQVEPGQTVTFADMTAKVGVDVSGGYGPLQSAKKRVFNDTGAVFSSIKGVGYARLRDGEIVEDAAADRRRVHRMATRATRKLAAVDFDALTVEQRLTHNVEMTIFNAQRLLARKSSEAKIRGLASKNNEALTLARTIEAFKGG